MSQIEYKEEHDNRWMNATDMLPPERVKNASKGLLETFFRLHSAGGESKPSMGEVRHGPFYKQEPHSHSVDEIVYMVQGSIDIEGRTLGPGSSFFIPGDTLHEFTTGPEGAQFLVFRPYKDDVIRPPAEHEAWMKEKALKQAKSA